MQQVAVNGLGPVLRVGNILQSKGTRAFIRENYSFPFITKSLSLFEGPEKVKIIIDALLPSEREKIAEITTPGEIFIIASDFYQMLSYIDNERLVEDEIDVDDAIPMDRINDLIFVSIEFSPVDERNYKGIIRFIMEEVSANGDRS